MQGPSGAGEGARAGSRYIGASLKRREDDRLLRGLGRFIDDIEEPAGTVFAAFVRSQHAHAAIRAIDPSKALSRSGVVGVYTGRDFAAWVKPFSCSTGAGGPTIDRPMVALETVRYVGEIVAVVLADRRSAAEDAAELVEVDYELLPSVVSIEQVLAGGAPSVHSALPDNVIYRGRKASEGIDGAFAAAKVVVRDTFHSSRLAAAPIECRGFLAHFDRGQERLTVWSPTQMPHRLRMHLADGLGLAETQVRVIAPADVGGSFGVKAYPYPEDLAGAAASRAVGRPIKWVQTRRDDFIASNHSRDYRFDVEMAFGADGAILALRAQYFVNGGAYSSSTATSGIEAGGAGVFMVGPYRLPHYAYEACSLATHTIPTSPVRGVAAPVCAFAVESLMDRAARRLALDPVELRRRNLIVPADLPYRNPLGIVHDTASHIICLDKALELACYAEFKKTRSGRRGADGRLRGIGLACIADHTGQGSSRLRARGNASRVPGFDSATVRIEPDGKVIVHVSHAAQGQGHSTVFAQVAADCLGVRVEDVIANEGDTAFAPFGTGTSASRGAVSGGGAVLRASQKVAEKLKRIAADVLEAAAADIVLGDGSASIAGVPGHAVPIRQLAEIAYCIHPRMPPAGEEFGLEAMDIYDPPTSSYSNATHVAIVAVDDSTGEVEVEDYVVVHDCGRMINPMIVDGQIHGGVAHGISTVLMEQMCYDADGQPLTGSFLDYPIPKAVSFPNFRTAHVETPSTITAGGFKGTGESGGIGAVPALTLAIEDALSSLRLTATSLPVTPPALINLIKRASSGS